MNKRILLVLGALVLVLTGCAQQPPQPQMTLSQVAPTPHCVNDKQCEYIWSQVPNRISMATAMKVRTVSANYIDTYDGNRMGRLYGEVTKEPDGQGGYYIRASFMCTYCNDLNIRALDYFNSMTNLDIKGSNRQFVKQ